MKKPGRLIFAYLFVLLSIVVFDGLASASLTLNTSSKSIDVDFFYHGSSIDINGVSGAGSDIIVKITSPEGHQTLKKKGKVAGILWMNVGDLKFEHTPDLFIIRSTNKIEDILNEEEIDKYILNYPALMKNVEISPDMDEPDKIKWFDEFVKFKEASSLYDLSFGGVETAANGEAQSYQISLEWPYQAAPGDYTVMIYEVKDKKIINNTSSIITVQQTGIVKTLSEMAKNNGALYGIISIVIALAAGFGVGIIFRGGGAH